MRTANTTPRSRGARLPLAPAVALVLLGLGGLPAAADSSIDPAHRHAYGANVGWLDARGDGAHGAVIGQYACSGSLWSANAGWIGLGNGPTNGVWYSNAGAGDWGVNHDGAGKLRGYAWGANVGWIRFEDAGNPRVDLLGGALAGYAWGANIGWIGLSNAQAFVRTQVLAAGPDSDGDGIPDPWELDVAGDLGILGPQPDDADGDGVPDVDEYVADTHPGDDTSYLHITDFARSGPTGQVTWTVSPARLYRLDASGAPTNAAGWTDSGLGTLLPGSGPTLTRTVVEPVATSRFYRVQAVVPLAP